MKKIITIFLFILSLNASAWTQRQPEPVQNCAVHSPYGFAQTAIPVIPICRQAYLVAYDAPVKIPKYVAYTLTPPNALGCVARTNAFVADQSLNGTGARPDDYIGTGYDKGHAVPDGDLSWDQQVEYESFLMSNMSPQLPGLNRGIWKLLESATGAWTFSRQHTLIIYAGNIYNVATNKKIGAGQVVVPDYLYKIVIDKNTGETLAFLFPHKENQGNDLSVVQVTVADIERASGIVFPVPPNANKEVKLPLWPVDFKSVADNKKAVCKG